MMYDIRLVNLALFLLLFPIVISLRAVFAHLDFFSAIIYKQCVFDLISDAFDIPGFIALIIAGKELMMGF
jgi:hypothetical protein